MERSLSEAVEMTEIINREIDVVDPPKPKKLKSKNPTITFKDVKFYYADANEPVFDGLDLEIKAGQKVGLVGHSGGGKSTFTRVLLRFADITSGEILIDGQNIAKTTQDDLRAQIAYVPQEPILFHRSILENIRYGRPEASKADVIKAAKLAHAHEFVKELSQGYDTLVGERGVKLSGGEKQRVAIARAMLSRSPILVMDEATSALDSKSEKLITQALDELMKKRTTIVIAHRLSTIRKLDRILVMENGQIVEDGSHASLLRKKGRYAELWSHQSGDFLPD